MKKSVIIFLGLMLIVLAIWKCSSPKEAVDVASNGLPQDAADSCTVSQDSFATWFANDSISSGGIVLPANSVTFPHRNNCDFYKWSAQMFLWITSPVNGQLVMESPTFYTVTPADSAGNRVFEPHVAGQLLRMTSSLKKTGPNRLPVVRSDNGQLFEIEEETPEAEKHLVKDGSGKTVEVASVKADAKGTFTFMDKAGKTISSPKAIIRNLRSPEKIVHRFKAGNKSVFLDAAGNIVQSESGQATGDALMTQGKSLVYYITMANDMYAWYKTAVKSGMNIDTTRFPTSATDRDSICKFARTNGGPKAMLDSNALAMELKTSWVEASTIPASEIGNYVTITAVIPKYKNVGDTLWVASGEQTAKMALIGMHVVGSVANHPEMIWATFEHQNNAPMAAYNYVNNQGAVTAVPASAGKGWLLTNNPADPHPNQSHITSLSDTLTFTSSDNLFARKDRTISPSNTQRTFAFGAAEGGKPNPENSSAAASNSEVISINNAIYNMLPATDVRRNYLFIGATWTANGVAPNSFTYNTHPVSGSSIGTSVLANSTMETYIQTDSTSCFSCHSIGAPNLSLQPSQLSHVYSDLKPLPVPDFNKIRSKK